MKKFSVEIYVANKLVRVIPSLSTKKIEQYKKSFSVQNGYYKIVECKGDMP